MGLRTNLVTNPRANSATTGYTGTSLVSMAQTALPDGDVFAVGLIPLGAGHEEIATGVKCVSDAEFDDIRRSRAVVDATDYVWSLFLYIEALTAASLRAHIQTAGLATVATETVTTEDAWVRVSVPFAATATETWIFKVEQIGAGAATFYTTGWHIEAAAALGGYFDGATSGAVWTGTAHASTSQILGASDESNVGESFIRAGKRYI